MKFRSLVQVFVPLSVGALCASASAREPGEVRGTIRMEGWVAASCHVSPPAQRHEAAASGAERIVLTFGNTCNQGSYKVWLESADGVQDINSSDGTSLLLATADRPLVEQSVLSHGQQSSFILDLNRSAVHPVITLRIQPSF
jgi:hypothetical protein